MSKTAGSDHPPQSSGSNREERGTLSDAARRALAEADMRRQRQREKTPPRELGGRQGPDPARYGDWENGGIVSDF